MEEGNLTMNPRFVKDIRDAIRDLPADMRVALVDLSNSGGEEAHPPIDALEIGQMTLLEDIGTIDPDTFPGLYIVFNDFPHDEDSIQNGIELIAEERLDQMQNHGRSIEDDVKNNANEELRTGAKALLLDNSLPVDFPRKWDENIVKHMMEKPYKERLIIAAALLAAEIDRVNLVESMEKGGKS